jgi:hypothetical protein
MRPAAISVPRRYLLVSVLSAAVARCLALNWRSDLGSVDEVDPKPLSDENVACRLKAPNLIPTDGAGSVYPPHAYPNLRDQEPGPSEPPRKR